MSSKDYYHILGVSKSATKEEIKKAFREKAHVFHPDKQGGNEEKFKELNEAYQVLGNDEKRSQYDQFGATFDQQGGFGQGMGWDDFMRQARQGGGSYSNINMDMGDLGDILGDLFGGGFGFGGSRRTQTKTKRGRDIEVDLNLSFQEAVFGADKIIELNELITCDNCQGNGAEPGTKISECKTCGGQGAVRTVQRTILGNIQTKTACPDCRGEGKKNEKNCAKCGGEGRVKEKKQISVKVPAGVDNGLTLKMSGEGEAGIKGGRTGDLYMHIHVKPDSRFKRQGDDILTHEEINFTTAALGGKISIQTVDGEVDLKIPIGTQAGAVIKLKGRGVPRFQHFGRGDHLVEIKVKIPKDLNKKQRELLEKVKEEGL